MQNHTGLLAFTLFIFFAPFTFTVQAQNLGTTVKIGKQVWVTHNLDIDTFRNGDVIPEAKTDSAWKKAHIDGKPAWCYLNNDAQNGKKYGKLYNWYTVSDPRGLAPKGYHVATKAEWDSLMSF